MSFLIISFLFLITLSSYIIYNTFFFQIFLKKLLRNKNYLNQVAKITKGKQYSCGYFASAKEMITKDEYSLLLNKQKINYNFCYNIIKFKTHDSNWEVFSYLIKEDFRFREIFNIRIFPHSHFITSEGNIEQNYSRKNIFTNNPYLTKQIEENLGTTIPIIIEFDRDLLQIFSKEMHFKSYNYSTNLDVNTTLSKIKSLNKLKSQIYKKENYEL